MKAPLNTTTGRRNGSGDGLAFGFAVYPCSHLESRFQVSLEGTADNGWIVATPSEQSETCALCHAVGIFEDTTSEETPH